MKLLHSIFPACLTQVGRLVPCSILFLFSCSVSKQISKQADSILLNDTSISKGHIGISIYEPATGKYWYNHNADKYFIPASNTKLFTLYAGMKYLGDSLVGARVEETWNTIRIYGTGDPTFLHPDFKFQPVFDYARSKKGNNVVFLENEDYNNIGALKPFGKGWSWDDYDQDYMPERNYFPVYGNVVRFSINSSGDLKIIPSYFKDYSWWGKTDTSKFQIKRERSGNRFYIYGSQTTKQVAIPFRTGDSYDINKFTTNIVAHLLSDTLGYEVTQATTGKQFKIYKPIRSQPSDSLFKPMMHNSDNFFAEQTLLMVSNEQLGYMSDEIMIDTLLKTDLKDVPQKPRWVDGSGLSRYNLFTPQSFVYILNKMKNEFGIERLKVILPTGGQGSLKNYFTGANSFIFAKTGTLSNNCALSGFLFTSKGKLLIFSVLVNNYPTGATPVRRAVEHFLYGIREKY